MDKYTLRARREILQRDATRTAAAAGIEVERSMLVPLLVARARITYDAKDIPAVEYQSLHGDWFIPGADIVREMLADPEFSPIFGKPKRSSVAKPTEPNPFRRGSGWNLTRQCWLQKNDPARAAHLKAETEE